jgi:hypothetical protein
MAGLLLPNKQQHVMKPRNDALENSRRLSVESLDEARQTLDPRWYRQEFECEFLGDSTLYFPPELIEAAIDENIEPFYR